jgi:hypothetical protein
MAALATCAAAAPAQDDDGNETEATPDLDLLPRVHPLRVDRGAYENECACPADVDEDGVVDEDDFLALLDAWGPCTCSEEMYGDGVVGIDDLVFVVESWGLCPCESGTEPDDFETWLEASTCLELSHWEAFVGTMMDEEESQATKDRWFCWFEHYTHCSPSCGFSPCSGADPFQNPCGGH